MRAESFHLALAGIVVVLSVAIFVALLQAVWPFTVDDSFITFRYAENLSRGFGPTYNPGREPVEGYTTFLWMLLMVIPHLLETDVILFSKLLGLLCTLGYIAACFGLVYQLTSFARRGDRWLAVAACGFMLASLRAVTTHAVSGMETALYTLLLTLFFYASFALDSHPTPRAMATLSLLGLLAGLTRPEANLVVGVGLLGVLARMSGRQRIRCLKTVLLLLVLPGAAYFAWRLGYYRQLFPLPFYVTGNFGSARSGVESAKIFLGSIAVPFGLLSVLGAHRIGARVLPNLFAALSLVLFFLIPVHRMAYGYRYFFPIVPFVCVLSATGVASLLSFVRELPMASGRRRRAVTAVVLAAIGLLLAGGIHLDFFRHGFSRTVLVSERLADLYSNMFKQAHGRLGVDLESIRPAHRVPVLAIADAGAVPYLSKWESIDTVGLNDAHIARSGEHDPAYVLSKNPDIVILLSKRRESFVPMLPWSRPLMEACLRAGMEVIDVRGSRRYALWVLARPENPLAQQLMELGRQRKRRSDRRLGPGALGAPGD